MRLALREPTNVTCCCRRGPVEPCG